jgi:hypothetical protein
MADYATLLDHVTLTCRSWIGSFYRPTVSKLQSGGGCVSSYIAEELRNPVIGGVRQIDDAYVAEVYRLSRPGARCRDYSRPRPLAAPVCRPGLL